MIDRHPIVPSYKHYNPVLLKGPTLQLTGGIGLTYLNNVAFAELVHLFQPRSFLDFGCYLGGLSLMVEDLLKAVNSDHQMKTHWYLVDDFSFLKIIDQHNKNFNPADPLLPAWVVDYCQCVRDPKSNGVVKKHTLPTTPEMLKDFVNYVCNYFGAPKPNIVNIGDSLDSVENIKFDMISYDLEAELFDEALLERLITAHLTDNGIIILDDVSPEHPAQLLTFLHLVEKFQLSLLAVAGKKVALTKLNNKDKNNLITSIYNVRTSELNDHKTFWWRLWGNESERFGLVLKMLPNSTYKNANLV